MKKPTLVLCRTSSDDESAPVKNTFEGTITFQMGYRGRNAATLDFFPPPNHFVYSLSGDKIKYAIVGTRGVGNMGDVILNGETNECFSVYDESKSAYRVPNKNEESDEGATFEIEKTDETTEILGYTCRKYSRYPIDAIHSEEYFEYVWVTDELKIYKPDLKTDLGILFEYDIDGVTLGVQLNTLGTLFTTVATEINPGPVPDGVFEVPADYEIE